MFGTLYAQNENITLNFSARNICSYTPLDSIKIENTSRGGKMKLHEPDTAVSFVFTNINDLESDRDNLFVSNNYPNPFHFETEIDIYVPEEDFFIFSAYDIMGGRIANLETTLRSGMHTLTFTPDGKSQQIVFVVRSQKYSEERQIMLHIGTGNQQKAKITHSEAKNKSMPQTKSASDDFAYEIGDKLEFTGYITDDYNNPMLKKISDAPIIDTDYLFNFNNVPPEAPANILGEELIFENQAGVEYIVEDAIDVITYIWSIPDDWEITEGQGENSIIVTSGEKSGNIEVKAKNNCGTSAPGSLYVSLISESANPPEVETFEVIEKSETSAIAGGNVISEGGIEISKRGIVWSTEELFTLENNDGITDEGTDMGEFESMLTNLMPGTRYYFMAYATNKIGTGYGEVIKFTTPEIKNIKCANDSITLSFENYKEGTIEWQRSEDLKFWETIPNSNSTKYTILPEESMYYRAVAKFSDRQPFYSRITFVKTVPLANAGFDRIIPGNEVYLNANTEEGSTGKWSILEGSDGVLSNINDNNAYFQGTDSIYSLTWELTNQCGTVRDTVKLRFRENEYIDNKVIVDTTDAILSSPAELARGIYKIRFSEPFPEITDSTVLVGITDGGFLREVETFTLEDNIFTIHTKQASLDDITRQGAFDLAQVFSIDTALTSNNNKTGDYIRLNQMPTREQLNADTKFRTGNYYYILEQDPLYLHEGVKLDKEYRKSEGEAFINLTFENTLLDVGAADLTLSGYYSFTPNFVADLDYTRLTLNSFRMGLSNATVEKNIKLSLNSSAEYDIAETEFTLLSASRSTLMIIGGVPVVVRANFSIGGEFNASLEAAISAAVEVTQTDTYNAYIEYRDGGWSNVYNASNRVSTDQSLSVSGSLEQDFSIGPRLSFDIYRIVGPYIDLSFYEELGLCMKDFNWIAGLDLGASLQLGAKAEVLGRELFDISRTSSRSYFHYSFPYKIEAWSGNNQSYEIGEKVEHNPRVKVSSNRGLPLPMARVMFSPQNGGSVKDSIITANPLGFAETTWAPGDSIQSNLEVFVLDCEGNQINNSPITFTAYADTTDICTNSSLSVGIVQIDSIISPEAQMGYPPYTYSTDGVSFSEEVPEEIVEPGVTYNFTVKDDEGCTAFISYMEPDPCEDTDLSLNIVKMGDTITIEAQGGAPPYTYSTDGENFSQQIPEITLEPGTVYNFVVEDQYGCTAMASHHEPDECEVLGLELDIVLDDDIVTVEAYGGIPPYYYSVDGENFLEEVPEFEIEHGVTYEFWVMDSVECFAMASYNSCVESGLELNITILGDNIIAEAESGTEPYLYAIGDTLNFSSGNTFGVPSGTHTVFVKDSLGCIVTQEVKKMECYDGLLIGNQCWMGENLNLDIGNSYCYNDDPVMCDVYGRYYDWETAMEACPVGWRLPNDNDWEQLRNYLISRGFNAPVEGVGAQITNRVGKAMASQLHWRTTTYLDGVPGNNPFLNNSSGFNGIPAGTAAITEDAQIFVNNRETARWWSSTQQSANHATTWLLKYDVYGLYDMKDSYKGYSHTIRCIKE